MMRYSPLFQRNFRNAFFLLVALLLTLAFPLPAYAHIQTIERDEAAAAQPLAPPVDAMPVDVEGLLTVLHMDDFDHSQGKYEVYLEDGSKKNKYRLRFEGELPSGFISGAKVRIHGFAKERDLYLPADGSTSSMTTLAPAATVVSGDQKTLVMVVNFKDAPVACPASSVRDLMFTDPAYKSVDDFYRETSFNQLSFSGEVGGPYTINGLSTDSCNPTAWADAADAAATAAKINVGSYTRKVYVLPSTNKCGYSGLGQVGGSPSRAWTFRCDVADSYTHELGHNLGMNHASTPTNEYADISDVMGYGGYGLRHLNSAHKEQMGWLPQQVAVVTQSNTYDIAPLETDQSQTQVPQVLKIAKPDTGEYYYLSYRLPIGFDSSLGTTYIRRLNIHRYAGTGGRTYLLQTLGDGGSFTDTANGVSVTQVSHSDSKVTVTVQLGASSSCQSGTPSLAISPSGQSGSAGSSLLYNVSLTNTDWSGCPNSSFNLSSMLPSGWSGSVSPATLTLGPGQSATATLTVASPSTANGGSYGLAVNVSDAANSKHAASASASYTVTTVTSCTRATPALVLSPSSQSGKAGNTLNYGVSIVNRDSSGCSSSTFYLSRSLPSGWSGSVSPGTITLAPGQSGSATLSVTSSASATAGNYAVSTSASDSAASNHSASAGGSYLITSDTQAPTAPTALIASIKGKQVGLAWKAATDNVGVSGYHVWRNGATIASTSGVSFSESLSAVGSYTYSVTAFDAAGNESAFSNTAVVTVNGKK
ncbi:MAG: NEW3 domain-containing protein [Methylomicrobium sp.]